MGPTGRWSYILAGPIRCSAYQGPVASAVGPAKAAAPVVVGGGRVSPGSGERGPARSPGSGMRTPPPRSWHSSSPGTPTSLPTTVLTGRDPSKEPIDDYLNRLNRQATALETLRQPLEAGMLETLCEKAKYEEKLFEEARDNPSRAKHILKREHAIEMREIDGTDEQQYRIAALVQMLEERGLSVGVPGSGVALGHSVVTPSETERSPLPSEPRLDSPGAGATRKGLQVYDVSTPRGKRGDMEERLRQLGAERAATRLFSEVAETPAVQVLLAKQTEIMEKLADKGCGDRTSTIRVEPKVHWPHLDLGDDGPGGREVEEFYENFEGICGLANNGKGVADKEMGVSLKSCLHESRKKIYETS